MKDSAFKDLSIQGLWKNNPATVQLLGLCPLLAVTGSTVNALGLGLATIFVLTGSNMVVSLLRNHVPAAVRLPTYVMIIASFTTIIQLLMQAFIYELYQVMALFVALIVTNCAVLGRADAFAGKNPVHWATIDGFMMGLGFTLVLLILGALREIIGQGTLFSNMDLLFGSIAQDWTIVLIEDYRGFLLAILPPGAFLGLGFIIALKNIIDDKMAKRHHKTVVLGAKRVRTTDVTG